MRRTRVIRAVLFLAPAFLVLIGASQPGFGQGEAPVLDPLGRRLVTGKTTTLAFNNVTVEKLIPFIVESTGKVVIPQTELLNRRITIINDEPIPQERALDMVFVALQQQGIGVVETRETITLRDIAEIERQDVPVIGPDDSVLSRPDLGSIAEKVFSLKNSSAEALGEMLKDSVPDYAQLTVDKESNQIVIRGNMALLQRMERLLDALDRPSAAGLSTRTFVLRFADAEQVAENIRELYAEESGSSGQGTNRGTNVQQFPFAAFGNRGRTQDQQTAEGQATAPSENLRVTANTQQNSVTVLGEEYILEQVRYLIETVWDQPLAQEAVVPRVYDLKHSDPIKVRDLLRGLFGEASGGQTQSQSSQGVGRLAGQFSFEAVPEAGRLVVVAKSPDNLFVIDEIITGLDQPQTAGLPAIIELKHASSEELAEQLNSLLSLEGTLAQIRRAESGLSESTTTSSPFAQDQATDDAAAETAPETITFWWQRARPPADNRGSSNLVGRIRIVPVWRQNAVMVMAPPEYQESVVQLVEALDRPGRQVLISAVIAEIELEDALALGLRWSSQTLTPDLPDNSINIGTEATAQENQFLDDLFDTSVLDVSVDLNLLLQALAQKTGVNILSEPRIFTGDNQEAEFFDGQDIPFVTEAQTTDTGNLIQSFDYRAVGISLRVRPRITVKRDVDLRVNLELSSIQPGQTLFGGFIVDRRETTTQLIVQDGQTVVISGILRSEESKIKRKVPLLGDIPLVGLLFQSVDDVTTNTELVAFITPLVVDNDTDVDRINEPFRLRLDQLREQLGAPEQTQPVEPENE